MTEKNKSITLLADNMDEVNEMLMQNAAGLDDPGLLNGKTGIALYFFYLAKETKNPDHQNFAEALLDEVYESIQNNPVSCGFGDGLAGIACAIGHLIQERFVDADVDDILSDADDKIYHYLYNSNSINFGLSEGLIGYMIYVISRLEGYKDANNKKGFVFERILMDLLNQTSAAFDERNWKVSEPHIYTLHWDFPLLLILLGKVKGLGLYANKVDRMIESLAPSALSLLPFRQANRLYLLFGLKQLLINSDLPVWENHAALIWDQFDVNILLDKELKDKNIFLSNGLAGLGYILDGISIFPANPECHMNMRREITEKIKRSGYFNSLIKGESETKPKLGLMRGLAGIGMQMLSTVRGDNVLAG